MAVAQLDVEGDSLSGGVVVESDSAAFDGLGEGLEGEGISCVKLIDVVSIGKNQGNDAVVDEILFMDAGEGFGNNGLDAQIKRG